MEGLNMDYILDDEAISLFNDNGEDEVIEETQNEPKEEKKEEEVTEESSDFLFNEEPESVGNDEKEDKGKEEDPKQESGFSPDKSNIFSSIAKAFVEEGILPDLKDEDAANVKTSQDFRKLIDDYIQSELTEQQRRVSEALNNNVQPDAIRQYESVLQYLDNFTEDILSQESEQAEEVRRRLIYQDYINRGFDQKRAEKEVNKSFSNGTDIDDAVEALESNKQFYKNQYNALLEQARQDAQNQQKELKLKAEKLKDRIMNQKNSFFGDLQIDTNTRTKIFDNIAKPIYKDPQTGEVYTAIQKYERENTDEFLAITGLLFTLTDGYKNLDKLTNKQVNKELKKGFRKLEEKLNNQGQDAFGNLTFMSGVTDDQSYLGKGIKLNI